MSFNSATAVTPWRTPNYKPDADKDRRLQFGHGGDAVENWISPRLTLIQQALQFGHGGDAVENFTRGNSALKAVEASIRPRR